MNHSCLHSSAASAMRLSKEVKIATVMQGKPLGSALQILAGTESGQDWGPTLGVVPQHLTCAGAGEFIVHQVDLTVDERCLITACPLNVAGCATWEIMCNLRVQFGDVVEVDDVHVCALAHFERTAVGEPNYAGRA